MKKIFSFLAAVLFAGSMMAADATMTKGTNGYDDFTVNGKPAVKIGTGSKGGDMSVTVGAGATSLTVYAAAWKGVSGLSLNITAPEGVTITPASINLVAEENFSGSEKAFTVADESAYKFDFVISGADAEATFTFTTSIAKRFLMWGATYEAAEGGETPVEPGDEPVAEWAEITFTEATAAGVFNDTVFTVEGSEFSLKCVDTDGKLKTTANNASFGTVEDRHDYAYRLQTGGKSSSKNNMELNIPADGQLRFAARTATASDETRTVVLVQGTDTIYNKVAVDKDTVKGASNPRIFNFAYVNVKAGKVAVSYPVNGVNFYSFAFKAGAAEEPVVEPEGPKNLGAKTIAEFLELKNTTDTCILTGVVSNIQNTTYGNFDLTDESGKVYVYGLLTPEGESKKFADLNVAEKDTLTVLAIYNEHNGNPQAKNAIFVEVKKSTAPVVEPVNLGAKTIAEFLELKNTKDTCILTGVVSNIVNTTYGNFDLTDKSGTVYVYGLLTPEGESKKFADLNVAEKDTLTVLAIYSEHNNAPQAKNAIFVEVKKAAVQPGETVELAFTDGGVDNRYYANYGSTDIQLYNIPVVGGQLQGDGDFLQLEVYPADPNDISGEYSIEDEGLDDYYTYLMRVNGTDTTEIEFVSGSITVSVQNPNKETSSADLTVQGQLMTAEGDVYVINSTLNVYYNFTISADEKYKFDEAEAEFNYNFDTYQILPTGSDVVVGVMAQTDQAAIILMIVLPEGQTELVAGEYEVSALPMYGTVMAGQYTADGVNPSYAMTTADQKLWYFVSGKVTVEGDGSIVIDALNSNGKAIKSTLNHLRGEGIDEVNAAVKATKTLKNGQLIIEKAGVRYNAQGAVIR